MTSDEETATFAGRLATFHRPHQIVKRRASSAKKKTATSVSWPHKTPTPETLAKAGLFYKPSSTSNDSVTCFLCHKAFDGWEVDDNPAVEHLALAPDCGWAINLCIGERSQDMDRTEEFPLSESLLEARRATFRGAWPHESKKGWKCKTEKMVQAGWCYNPSLEADDYVTCFYCGLALDGWEPKDDPWQEHKRRAPECHFFTLIEEHKKLMTSAKGRKGRLSRNSSASHASRLSVVTTNAEAPSMISPTVSRVEEGDTLLTSTTTHSGAGKSRKKAVRGKAAQNTRQKPDHKQADDSQVEQDTTTAHGIDVESYDGIASFLPEPSAELQVKQKRAAKTRQSLNTDSSMLDAPSARETRPAKKQSKLSADASQLQAELENDASVALAYEKSIPLKGTKRTSDGRRKDDSSLIIVEGKPTTPYMPPAKRGRPGLAAKAEPPEPALSNSVEARKMREVGDVATDLPTDPLSITGRFAKVAQEQIDHGVHEADSVEVDHDDAHETQQTDPKPQPKQMQTRRNDEDRITAPDDQTFVEEVNQPAARLSLFQPTSIASPLNTKQQERAMQPLVIIPCPTREKTVSPTWSGQSSDAENQPPTSRPSYAGCTPASSKRRTTTAPLAKATPAKSPYKNSGTTDRLVSSVPWHPVDLETIFLPSPLSRHTDDKINLSLEQVFERMTSPERKMNVEEWIMWRAKSADEELRKECERMIGAFEGEGMKALRAMEGVECA